MMNEALARFCISGEYISLPPEAVNVLYDAGEVVMVTSRFLKRRASTEKIVLLRSVSALIYGWIFSCVRIMAVPAGMVSSSTRRMPSVISMPSAAVGISISRSEISPSGVR